MAVADIVAKIAAATWVEELFQTNIWMTNTNDKSGDFPGWGNSVGYPKDASQTGGSPGYATQASSITVDSTVSQLEWGTPEKVNASEELLTINKQYAIDRLINPVQTAQVRPSFMESAVRHSARVGREYVNAQIRAQILADVTKTAGVDVSVTVANWGKDAHVTAMKQALRDAADIADDRFWAQGTRRVVMSPATIRILADGLAGDRNFIQNGDNERAIREGLWGRYMGWDLIGDNSLGGSAHTASDDAKHPFIYLTNDGGFGCYYAGELTQMRVFQSETYKAQRMQGLFTFGVAVVEDNKIFRGESVIT